MTSPPPPLTARTTELGPVQDDDRHVTFWLLQLASGYPTIHPWTVEMMTTRGGRSQFTVRSSLGPRVVIPQRSCCTITCTESKTVDTGFVCARHKALKNQRDYGPVSLTLYSTCLPFLAETVFFSHNNSARTVFFNQFQSKFCQPNGAYEKTTTTNIYLLLALTNGSQEHESRCNTDCMHHL